MPCHHSIFFSFWKIHHWSKQQKLWKPLFDQDLAFLNKRKKMIKHTTHISTYISSPNILSGWVRIEHVINPTPPPPPQTSHFQEDIAREKHTSWRAESGCTSKRARTLQLHIACERLKIWNCRAWRRGEKKNRVSTPCETLNWSYFSFRREGRRRPTKYIKKE